MPSLLDQAWMFFRFAAGLPRFLRTPLTLEAAQGITLDAVRDREARFLALVRRGVCDSPRSPYRALLRWAGVEYGDIESMVLADGVDSALGRLYDAGVRISLDEFKGKRPIERSGLTIECAAKDFDNPLTSRHLGGATGGSTGASRRLAVDFELLVHDAAFQRIYFDANGLTERPGALWWPVPPGLAGIFNALIAAKMNRPVERWFSPQPITVRDGLLPSALLTFQAAACGKALSGLVPWPRFTPLDDGLAVASWAAQRVADGQPPWISLPASSAARVAQAALGAGLDISGVIFRVGGEPLTAAKHKLIRKAGAETVSAWALAEAGILGGGCADRKVADEVHVDIGKLAVIQRAVELSGGAETVEALHLTTLLPQTPKIMLNVDSGDYGILSRRDCGCPMHRMGFDLHLDTIRNYEKLTVNGMHFLGSQLSLVVEETLPGAFGGAPTDYQFAEYHRSAIGRVAIVISPRVGPLDEERVIALVLDTLAASSRGDIMMAANWRESGVLHVARREPQVTAAAKTPAIVVIREQTTPAS